jgi:hypothetical protein
MRYKKLLTATIIVCIIFSSCSTVGSGQNDYFGFKTSVFTVVDEKDTHGGFHGDGDYYLILDCSEKAEQAKELIDGWKPLPLTENLQRIMNMTCSGEEDGVYYSKTLTEIAHWPIIENGVYKFIDRHTDAIDETDDTDLFNRYSYNFSIAVYDLDANMLYYFECDT